MGDDRLSLDDLLRGDPWSKGPTMAELHQYMRDQAREKRAELHKRAQALGDELMTAHTVRKALLDDDLELDLLGADIPGLSLQDLRRQAEERENELKSALYEIQSDPDYQAA